MDSTKASDIASENGNVTLIAKFGKDRITLPDLPAGSTTIGHVKEMLQARTRVLPKRQKLVGLLALKGGAKGVHDDLPLSDLKVKGNTKSNVNGSGASAVASVATHQFILMGTPEEEIFVDPSERDDLPEVVDDFELDFNAGSTQWLQHVAACENLKKFTAKTEVHFMHQPRPGKPLLVLDLDHTLLDFSSRQLQADGSTHLPGRGMAAAMKRPYMDDFLCKVYPHYDLAVWSQTSWRWLEVKLTELGMLAHAHYKFCFVLDKTSMFRVQSTKRDGTTVQHHVKPLQLIWSKFPAWSATNTIHIDDLARNFALNLGCGLKCKAYHRKKASGRRDAELLGIGQYLQLLAESGLNFEKVDFGMWQDVVAGKRPLAILPAGQNDDDENDGDQPSK